MRKTIKHFNFQIGSDEDVNYNIEHVLICTYDNYSNNSDEKVKITDTINTKYSTQIFLSLHSYASKIGDLGRVLMSPPAGTLTLSAFGPMYGYPLASSPGTGYMSNPHSTICG